MTRSELIARLAARNSQLPPERAKHAVKVILEAVSTSLAKGKRVEIRCFGSFATKYRSRYAGRNPKTGELLQLPARHVTHFKAAKELRTRVNYK